MELPKRKQIRLKDFDYRQNGAYFITMCIKDRHEMLWKQSVGARIARPQEPTQLSNYGLIVDKAISNISKCYPNVIVDKYVIMPNHIHMIILLGEYGGRAMRAPTISTIINQFKGYVTKQIGFSLWQRNYYDHIIRNEQEYQKIWEYIDTNPLKWSEDCYYINS